MLDFFRCHSARLHTLPDAPTLHTANHEQLVQHHHNLKARNADKIQPRFGTQPDDEDGFFESGCHGMLEHEDLWQQCQLVWAWIDERPVWESPVDWTCGEFGILPEPTEATTRRFRLSLLGGGQITVSEKFELWDRAPPLPGHEFYCTRCDLRVTADAGDGLRRFAGTHDGTGCEMGAHAVLFPPGTPQSIADRVAATFRLLTRVDRIGTTVRGPDLDNFMALLDRSERCCVCVRPLHDHVSTLLGVGPDCAKQLRLPHGLEAANRILQRRRELLDGHSCAGAVQSRMKI
jgi:hypothetical protein